MSKLTQQQKDKLKKLLKSLATDDEKEELKVLDATKVKEIVSFYEEEAAETEGKYEALLAAFSKFANASTKHTQSLVDTFSDFHDGMLKKLDEVGNNISTTYVKNKPFNAAGVYKDMINQLSAVKDAVEKKPVPVWSWPQYAGVSVRNKNFANVNPAISPFGIEDFDDIQLAYDGSGNIITVDYYLSGAKLASLTLSYDGSNNLTEAKRTQ